MDWKALKSEYALKPLKLIVLFSSLAVLFWYSPVSYSFLLWWILVACAVGWLFVELRNREGKGVWRAAGIGLFLMLFDFAVENLGKIAGLWESFNSAFLVLAVPIEVMLLALIGGTAWALYQPKEFSGLYSLTDILVFAAYGTLGEFILGEKGLMIYMGGWTSFHAFVGYVVTWAMLHAIVYWRNVGLAPKAVPSA